MRSVKVRAAQTDRTLTETVTELLKTGLKAAEILPMGGERVEFPLILAARKAEPGELSPDRVAAMLADAEAEDVFGSKP